MIDYATKVKRLLSKESLQVLNAVVMALRDLEDDALHCAMLRLRQDQDKFCTHDRELYELISDYFNNHEDFVYHDDYPKEPIGEDNPYYCCSHCGVSAPEINGKIDGHLEHCEYRLAKEKLYQST